MLTTVEGIYEHGRITLLEPLPGVTHARVAVTVMTPGEEGTARIGHAPGGTPPTHTLRRMSVAERQTYIAGLHARWQARMSPSADFARAKTTA